MVLCRYLVENEGLKQNSFFEAQLHCRTHAATEVAAHNFGDHKKGKLSRRWTRPLKEFRRRDRRAEKRHKKAADNAIKQLQEALEYDKK